MISSAWGLSCVMWVIPIYAWQYIEGERKVVNIFNGLKIFLLIKFTNIFIACKVPEDECYVQFVETNNVMSILCAVMAFYLPVTIMVGFLNFDIDAFHHGFPFEFNTKRRDFCYWHFYTFIHLPKEKR